MSGALVGFASKGASDVAGIYSVLGAFPWNVYVDGRQRRARHVAGYPWRD